MEGSKGIEGHNLFEIRKLLRRRRAIHQQALKQEVQRLTAAAAALGVQRVILFGSLARHDGHLTSDLDLLIVWDTPLGFLDRTVELYRRLQPRVAADFIAYTPAEMERMSHTPFVQRALAEGKVLFET